MKLREIFSLLSHSHTQTNFFKTHEIEKISFYTKNIFKCLGVFNKIVTCIPPCGFFYRDFLYAPFAYPHILRHKHLPISTQSAVTKTRRIGFLIGR